MLLDSTLHYIYAGGGKMQLANALGRLELKGEIAVASFADKTVSHIKPRKRMYNNAINQFVP